VNTFLTLPCGAQRVFMMMARIVLSSDSDDVFEAPRSRTAVTNRRRRNHGDLDVDAADRVPVVTTVVATETHLQVFYFSQKCSTLCAFMAHRSAVLV
jgi:hypothetical protein